MKNFSHLAVLLLANLTMSVLYSTSDTAETARPTIEQAIARLLEQVSECNRLINQHDSRIAQYEAQKLQAAKIANPINQRMYLQFSSEQAATEAEKNARQAELIKLKSDLQALYEEKIQATQGHIAMIEQLKKQLPSEE